MKYTPSTRLDTRPARGVVDVVDAERTTPWLAIDAATPPLQRARELRRAWERFIAEGSLTAVRPPVADSWQRSRAAGVDPSAARPAPVLADNEEAVARWEVHPLAAAAPLVRDCLAGIAAESGHLIVITDADGMLLWIDGSARVRVEAADSMNFAEGTLWSEGGAGTNAIGTAIAADHALQIFAAEHFNEVVQRWTCSAAPVHDPDDGRLLGVIDLTGLAKTAHPHSLAVAQTAARAVESELRLAVRERDARLRSRYEERIAAAGGQSALVTPTGRVLAQTPTRWLPADRLALPAGGGEVVLPSGTRALAEPIGNEEAFLVRRVGADPARHEAEVRRRVIEAADAERARLARDLHDGAQQRLVHTVITLKLSRRALQEGDESAEALVSEALENAERAQVELRELAHGTLPAVLTRGGLRVAVERLASRLPLPVAVDVSVGRLARTIEAHAYFIVAESLTNVVKHANASAVEVRAAVVGGVLRVEVRDNGIGGARLEGSSGLSGLDDRVASVRGQLQVTSPPGGGTRIIATLPLPA
jgi:signal transduction histidine kinase